MLKITKGLMQSKENFLMLTPSPLKLLKFKWLKPILITQSLIKGLMYVNNNRNIPERIGHNIGNNIIDIIILSRSRNMVNYTFKYSNNHTHKLSTIKLRTSRRKNYQNNKYLIK